MDKKRSKTLFQHSENDGHRLDKDDIFFFQILF